MTVQRLSGDLDRIAGKGALQDGEHAVSLLAQRVETGADDAEVLGAGDGAETSRDLLLDPGYAYGALANVVCERHGRGADEALARRLRGFRMQRFAFPHQRVVHGAEGGQIVGIERALLAPSCNCIIDSGHC